ncbi:alpha/beta fold hydrolase [Thiospirillum jenense]|uniref:alpha/beta fold hydrolase n=1 Tax=Thiospirillum jenense TaxID=1653858 RepID=UPI001EEA2F0B|nr:alpha/beta hydrolase [Thiospirillum jenense]
MIIIVPLLIDLKPADGEITAPAAAEVDSQFVRIPFPGTAGINFHIHSTSAPSGDANAFVLLHGFTFNVFTWDALFPFFAAQGQVIAYDQIPYGLSDKLLPGDWTDANPYSKAAAIKQLFALMDQSGIEQAILVGNSAGGTLALEAALTHPERIKALILIDPWIYAQRPTLPQFLVETPQLRRISLFLARHLGGEKLPLLERSYADPERITPERRTLAAIHSRLANWDVAWAALLNHSLMDKVTVSAHLGEIKQPVLIIAGSEDRLVPVEDSARAARAFSNAEFAVLPDCGHVPHEECPDLTKAVIAHWLRALPQRAVHHN